METGNGNTHNAMENGRGDRYGYDPEGQLTAASYRALNPETETPTEAMRADSFSYDALGNRQGTNYVASRGAVDFTRRDNGLNQYLTWSPISAIYYDDNLGAPWVFPGNGVMMADGWITASYNALNQPMAMGSIGLGNTFYWFWHDPLGRCVKRWLGTDLGVPVGSNPTTYFYYEGWNLVQEGPNASTSARTYVHGGRVDEIVASQAGGVWVYHHYDACGHCILLTKASDGSIREQYDYDAFGYPYHYNAYGVKLGSTGQFGNRFLFTGREWLKDLRVYDYRNRIYQPELGRFLQPDPKGFEAGDYNLYRYCHNDPVNRSDPDGLQGLLSEGRGDWDFYNGRVAEAQIALQNPQVDKKNEGSKRAKVSYVTSIDTSRVTYLGRTFNGGMKTTQTVTVDPCDCKVTDAQKAVGLTNEYGPTGKVIGTGKASGNSIRESVPKKGGDCEVRMRGNEGNPLVLGGPGITYDAKVTFHPDKNTYDWKVKHDAYPSHRLYGPDGNAVHKHDPATSGSTPWRLWPPTPSIHSSGTSTY